MENINYSKRAATTEEFIGMRKAVGWNCQPKDAITKGLQNNLFSICVENDNELIGYGRVIGDGSFTFYIQDIIVKPEYQAKGIGRRIMSEIMGYIKENSCKGAMVGLMSAAGKEGFYKKFGFIERPSEKFGAGMFQFLRD